MNRYRWKAILVLIATFLLGGIAGGFAMRAFSQRELGRSFRRPWPEAREGFLLEAMTRRLGLSDDQRDRIAAIIESHREERRRIAEKCRPAQRELRGEVDAEIRAVLDPDQRKRYDEFARRRDDRRSRRGDERSEKDGPRRGGRGPGERR